MILYLTSSSPDINEPRATVLASSIYPVLPFSDEKEDWLNYGLENSD